ncbi:unnamed protein product [Cuscuta campestris]|uniref:PHD-type domain-containing protein n=1 Tax=Cuscuta campestris TaxID=132261 RepID=A0A484LSI9_9ASTE|nr:unnamed protein product [Cuscuta campestris]
MPSPKEVNGLRDDGFEGSLSEDKIFKEVFFENSTNKRKCLVTAKINFESDNAKESIVHVGSPSTLEASSGGKVHAGKEPSNARTRLGSSSNASVALDGVSVDASSCMVTVHLLESYKYGVIHSCYMQKSNGHPSREHEIGKEDTLRVSPKFNENDVGKEMVLHLSTQNYANESKACSSQLNNANISSTVQLARSNGKDSSIIADNASKDGRSVKCRVPKKKSLSSLGTVRRRGPTYWETSRNEKGTLDNISSLGACGLDGTTKLKDRCVVEVPVSSGNNAQSLMDRTEAVINNLACNTNCLSLNKNLSVYHKEEKNGVSFEIPNQKRARLKKHESFSFNSSDDLLMDIQPLKTVTEYASSTAKTVTNSELKAQKKLKLLSKRKLTDSHQHDTAAHNCNAGSSEVNRKGARGKKGRPKKLKKLFLKENEKKLFVKSRPLKQPKRQKGSCKLLLRGTSRGGGKDCLDGMQPSLASRTVLSWLIHNEAVYINEVIEYHDPQDHSIVKVGSITTNGILCKCCGEVLSISKFKSHAGFKLNYPCMNLLMETGKPFILCQFEAWLAEYKAKKQNPQTVLDEMDQNDDSCGRCGEGGELICCDNCPSTFHQVCLYAQELPEGNWYCPHCACRVCGDVVKNNEGDALLNAQCVQCEHQYHAACLNQKGFKCGVASDLWFCGEQCEEVHTGLRSLIGLVNQLADGFSWRLLKCIPCKQKTRYVQQFVALHTECNSKLAVALTIMEESFLPMVDPITGIDMLPQVVYNWGSQLGRLNYSGFYTVVLEKDDILISVASIRIHGAKVAEMPLIATCSEYRRQGMCRRLMKCIEEMLKWLKVEKFVISAIPSLVEAWTVGFGFEHFEEDDKRSLSDINMMVFPKTVWLKKTIYEAPNAGQQHTGSRNAERLQSTTTPEKLLLLKDESCGRLPQHVGPRNHSIEAPSCH